MAYSELALYVDGVAYGLVAQWAATHAYTVGQIVRQLAAPTANNERCFICIVAGTSLSTEPTWVLTRGAKTTESGGPTWMECTGLPALNGDNTNTNAWHTSAGGLALGWIIKNTANDHYFICTTAGTGGTGGEPAWSTTTGATSTDGTAIQTCIGAVSSFTTKLAVPHARLTTPLASSNAWLANAGMNVYVGDDHSETYGGGTGYGPTVQCAVLCFDHTVALPPGSANLKTTALITATSTIPFLNGTAPVYVYGIQISASGSVSIQIANSTFDRNILERCTFGITSTSGTNCTFNDTGNTNSPLLLKDCTFSIANFSSGQVFYFYSSSKIENSTFTATLGTAGLPLLNAGNSPTVVFEGCDFSGVSNSAFLTAGTQVGNWTFKDCVIPAGIVISSGAGGIPTRDGLTVDLNRVDSGTPAIRNERYRLEGKLTTAPGVVRTGGASDGATPISHQIVTNANTDNKIRIFNSVPFAIWNAVTGSNRNVTAYGIANDFRVPNNDEVWFDVEYLGSATSPKGSYARGGKANVLASGSALTADTSAWTVGDMSTPRGNSLAYSLGAVISVPDNTSCRFFCTTAGTSASSEPLGWNPADLAGGVTLSGGNLTVTSSSTDGGVRSIAHNTTGKYYFEGTWTSVPSSTTFGLASTSQVLSQANCLHAVGIQGNGGIVAANTSIGSVGATITAGQTTCIAVDLTNQLIWFRTNNGNWNNSGTANPATGTGGIAIPGAAGLSGVANYALFTATAAGALVANFGGPAFAYTAPSGFTAWNGAGYSTATDGQTVTDGTATFLANNDWPHRRNSFPYQPGNFFMTASNAGRVFFCTAAGTSAASEPVATVGTTTFSSTDKSASITLSNGNLTVQFSSGGTGGVRSVDAQTQGKFYCEFTWVTSTANMFCGIATPTVALASPATNSIGGVIVSNFGSVSFNAIGEFNIGAIAAGNVVRVAVDMTNKLIWMAVQGGNWNGSGTANPATGVGGLDISSLFGGVLSPANAYVGMTATGTTITANFGASTFAFTPPTGFSAGPKSTGYSGALDGGIVYDGTALFRAGCRFSQTLTLSVPQPQLAGYLYAYPKLGRPSMTYYIDPIIVLS